MNETSATPPERPEWTRSARALGIASAAGVALIGAAYVAVIASWLTIERTPREPIGDPYLAAMEVLTIASGAAILGLMVALRSFADRPHRVFARAAFGLGVLGSGTTMAVHFVNLTAVRQSWRRGEIADYRLVWPSSLFAVEYFAWDVLFGLTMIAAGLAFGDRAEARRARTLFLAGGTLSLAGVTGPASGWMALQNLSVLGYAILLPIASACALALFRAETSR